MEFSVGEQLEIFVAGMIFGFSTALFFDLFRVFRKIKKAGTVSVEIQDALFWIVTAVSAFLFMLKFNSGRFRFFMLFASVCGAFLYFKFISRFVFAFLLFLSKIIRRILSIILKILLLPLKALFRLLKRPVYIIFNFSKTGFFRVLSKIRKNIMIFTKIKGKI